MCFVLHRNIGGCQLGNLSRYSIECVIKVYSFPLFLYLSCLCLTTEIASVNPFPSWNLKSPNASCQFYSVPDLSVKHTLYQCHCWLHQLSCSEWSSFHWFSFPVMWSETIGLRTRPVWDQKKSVSVLVLHTAVLVLQVWYCFVKNDLVTLVVIMILKDTTTFKLLFIVSLFCAWNMAFTYLKVKSAKCLCLLPVVLVLVLRIWSCLHHCSFLFKLVAKLGYTFSHQRSRLAQSTIPDRDFH